MYNFDITFRIAIWVRARVKLFTRKTERQQEWKSERELSNGKNRCNSLRTFRKSLATDASVACSHRAEVPAAVAPFCRTWFISVLFKWILSSPKIEFGIECKRMSKWVFMISLTPCCYMSVMIKMSTHTRTDNTYLYYCNHLHQKPRCKCANIEFRQPKNQIGKFHAITLVSPRASTGFGVIGTRKFPLCLPNNITHTHTSA